MGCEYIMNNAPARAFSFAHALPGWQFFLLFVAAAATACGALASGFCAAPPGLNSRLLLGARVLFANDLGERGKTI